MIKYAKWKGTHEEKNNKYILIYPDITSKFLRMLMLQ